jgi:hypothetical protein
MNFLPFKSRNMTCLLKECNWSYTLILNSYSCFSDDEHVMTKIWRRNTTGTTAN